MTKVHHEGYRHTLLPVSPLDHAPMQAQMKIDTRIIMTFSSSSSSSYLLIPYNSSIQLYTPLDTSGLSSRLNHNLVLRCLDYCKAVATTVITLNIYASPPDGERGRGKRWNKLTTLST